MIGIAWRTARTSAPTKPTTILVLVDEDCTKDSGQNANHDTCNGIVCEGEQIAGPLAAKCAERSTHEVKTEEEKVQRDENSDDLQGLPS